MAETVPGQRYVSEREPELGLGRIASVNIADKRVAVDFPATKERRLYALGTPVLKRVRFRPGETLALADGDAVTVDAVEETNGLLVYVCGGRHVPEDAISDVTNVSSPAERFAAGQCDENEVFDLRLRALQMRARLRQSAVRGFLGGRVELIPHQFYILREVSSRQVPRVLLADEVGLGKTIEACLILQRLLATGQVKRALILVPETLVHQWFVELLRRFNLWFGIYDEARCQSVEQSDPGTNPFLSGQLALASVTFLSGNPTRREQAVAAGWDLLVVDEAHHLTWSPPASETEGGIGIRRDGEDARAGIGAEAEKSAASRSEGSPLTGPALATGASPEYALVEELARQTAAVLLLTATPTQLGEAGHFARLRLLDPDRYKDYDAFRAQSRQLGQVASLANRIVDGEKLDEKDRADLARLFERNREQLTLQLAAVARGEAGARDSLLRTLLDQHGIGRVMFRNTRAAISGFPVRQYCPAPVPNSNATLAARVAREFTAEEAGEQESVRYNFREDPRIDWLVALLRGESTSSPGDSGRRPAEKADAVANLAQPPKRRSIANAHASGTNAKAEKVLLICRSARKAIAIETALQERMKAKSALFHEGLPLVQRDRNAAWFAEPDGRSC